MCDFDDTHLATHARELNQLYPDVEVHTRQFDASDENAVKAVIDDALQRYGRLDVFFANAGIVGQNQILSDIEGSDFMDTLRVNVLRYVWLHPGFARVLRFGGCQELTDNKVSSWQ